MPQSILPADNTLHLNHQVWGLAHARGTAAEILANSDLLKPLVRALLGPDPILRRHVADTARRITEKQPELLAPYGERLLGLFSEIGRKEAAENWRTRAHLGLLVARFAQSRPHRLRAAGLLMPLYYDPPNVVRCAAVEGLGLLAWREPSIRPQIQPLIEEVLVSGTIAMRCRARDAMGKLQLEFSRTRG